MWWLYLIKFFASIIAVFSTALFINSIISSIVSGPQAFRPKDDVDTTKRDATLRVILAFFMAINWSILIVF